MNLLFVFLFFVFPVLGYSLPYPIQFSIPEEKIVSEIPEKDRDFAFIIPGKRDTYIYGEEAAYYASYRRAYYALTTIKAGWDCMRHFEILANGCIPYFVDLDQCPEDTLTFLPKDLILEAMNLEGVSYYHIDHSKFDRAKYYEILHRLLTYTREHLSSRKIAEYLLNKVDYSGEGKVLFLSPYQGGDYLRCLTLIGLKQACGEKMVDVPKVEHIYKNYPHDPKRLYGMGFSYTRVVEDLPIDREDIEERIKNREFELIVYGSVHRGTPYKEVVNNYYPPDKVLYLCGEDIHWCPYYQTPNLFLREFDPHRQQNLSAQKAKELKVLVLVLASDDEPVYLEHQKYWQTYMNLDPRVECYFLKADPNLSKDYQLEGNVLWVKTKESYIPGMLEKTITGLEAFFPRLKEFDYVLRTNLSSFIVFKNLLSFLDPLPRNRCYCALSGITHRIPFGSGAAFILSKDMASLLVQNRELFMNSSIVDDVHIGLFFHNLGVGILPSSRIDIGNLATFFQVKDQIKESNFFHIRMKHQDSDRATDESFVHSELIKIFYPEVSLVY